MGFTKVHLARSVARGILTGWIEHVLLPGQTRRRVTQLQRRSQVLNTCVRWRAAIEAFGLVKAAQRGERAHAGVMGEERPFAERLGYKFNTETDFVDEVALPFTMTASYLDALARNHGRRRGAYAYFEMLGPSA